MSSQSINPFQLLLLHRDDNEFLQLSIRESCHTTCAEPAHCECAFQKRTSFAQYLSVCLPGADLCSVLFSPHALIDCLYKLTCQPNFVPSADLLTVYHKMMTDFGFLFFEICDTLHLQDQPTFRDLYLNRSDVFRAPEQDITFAIDFALGLGVEGSFITFYHAISSFLSGTSLSKHAFPPAFFNKMHCIQQLYQRSSTAANYSITDFLNHLRNKIRFFASKYPQNFPASDADYYEELLYQEFQLLIAPETLSTNFEPSCHFYGIRSPADLLHRIAHVYINTLQSRIIFLQQLHDQRCSQEQIDLMQPKLQILPVSGRALDIIPELSELISGNREMYCPFYVLYMKVFLKLNIAAMRPFGQVLHAWQVIGQLQPIYHLLRLFLRFVLLFLLIITL